MAIRRAAFILAILLGCRVAFAAPQLTCRTADEYRVLLASLERRLQEPSISPSDLASIAVQIPKRCDFSTAGHTFHIPTSEMQAAARAIAACAHDPLNTGNADLDNLHAQSWQAAQTMRGKDYVFVRPTKVCRDKDEAVLGQH